MKYTHITWLIENDAQSVASLTATEHTQHAMQHMDNA